MGTQTGAAPAPSFSPEVEHIAPNAAAAPRASVWSMRRTPAFLATAASFAVLFAKPLFLLGRDWWTLPEAGHGLLLGPVAIWLAWRSGIRDGAAPNRAFGFAVLVFAVLVRCAAGLAAELFTMRASIIIALAGLTI